LEGGKATDSENESQRKYEIGRINKIQNDRKK
jgi:hypothetical protein